LASNSQHALQLIKMTNDKWKIFAIWEAAVAPPR
jgi:hypothetical protein